MAGTIGQGAQILGQALIPETMANFQRQGLLEQAQRKQQVEGINQKRLFGVMDAGGAGTPQTKSYEVNGKTYGADVAATPLFSTSKKQALFSAAMPEQAKALQVAQLQEQLYPTKVTGKDRYMETPNGVFDVVTQKYVAGTEKAPEKANKEGDTKDFVIGTRLVPHEYKGGRWVEMEGMGGPRWEGQKAPVKPFGYDEEQAAKKAKEERDAAEAARKGRADEYAFQSTDEGFSEIMRMAAKLGTNPDLEKYTGSIDGNTFSLTAGAKQFENDLKVLKSNLAMNALNAARAGSANGSTGFGALSEGELAILQNQIATLDPTVGKENFQKQVVDIIRRTKGTQGRLRSARPADAPAPSTNSALTGFSIQRIE